MVREEGGVMLQTDGSWSHGHGGWAVAEAIENGEARRYEVVLSGAGGEGGSLAMEMKAVAEALLHMQVILMGDDSRVGVIRTDCLNIVHGLRDGTTITGNDDERLARRVLDGIGGRVSVDWVSRKLVGKAHRGARKARVGG